MKELYDKVIKAYNANDEKAFMTAARNWIDAGGDNPFEQDTKEHDLYFKAVRECQAWRKGGVGDRISKVNMIKYVRQIAELHVANPYKIKIEKTTETIKPKKPVQVLGVIPEEKISSEQTKNTKSDKKHLFNKPAKKR